MGSGRGPLPFPPPTRPPPVADPHYCAPLRAGEMGPPYSWPKGQSWASLKPCCARARGWGLGKPAGPPSPPLPVPYILERHPLPGASQPKGGPRFALSSSPAEVGHSRAGASQLGPHKERRPGNCSPYKPGWGWRVLAGGGWGQRLGGGVPCRHVGDLPSAKRFPLSRSKNTKLGTPGAPQPRLPGPIPTPTPGWPSWVGGLGGGIPSHPIHLSPSRPSPCLALGKTFPTKSPHPLAKAITLGWASASSAPKPGPPGPLLVPQAWPASSHLPRNWTFLPNHPKGLGKLNHKRKTLPHQPPSHCPEAFKNPWSVRLSPGPPPLGGCWGPKHGPLSGRAGGGGSCSWGIRKLLSREP
uniref:Protein transport protein Sec24-like At4g32640 n=1 Tax=Callorhinus ursinus TaxID=34884 RepID=A0A3Q7NDQ2_CALUR|nr:protein transport protein Sec24-like At4g32640 [Callorhinus ursinus]